MRAGTQTPDKALYTMLLPPDPAHSDTAYPQGTGYANVSISTNGLLSVVGALGDGAKFSAASALRTDNTFLFYAGLYAAPHGEIYGTLNLRDVPGVSDLDGSLTWIKPQQIKVTPQQPSLKRSQAEHRPQ